MRRTYPLFASIAAAALALVQAGFAGAWPRTSPARAQIGKPAVGRTLADGRGRTLSHGEPRKETASALHGARTSLWPPPLTSAAAHAERGTSASLAGSSRDTNAQAGDTDNGHALYYLLTDNKAARLAGQALKQFGALWYVVSPARRRVVRRGS